MATDSQTNAADSEPVPVQKPLLCFVAVNEEKPKGSAASALIHLI